MKDFLNYLLARLGEPSTYRGLFALLTALGLSLHPEQAAAITSAGLAAIGAINVFRREQTVKLLLLAGLCLLTLPACDSVQRERARAIGLQIAEAGGKSAAVAALDAAEAELHRLETAPLPAAGGPLAEVARAAALAKARDLVAQAREKVARYHATAPSGK